jgi:hypothetical protein
MKRRHAIKGRRASETVADLEAALDKRARRRADEQAIADLHLAQRRAAGFAMLEAMMASILDAHARGDITLANHSLSTVGAVFGARAAKHCDIRYPFVKRLCLSKANVAPAFQS